MKKLFVCFCFVIFSASLFAKENSVFNLKATVLSYITGSGKLTAEIKTFDRHSVELTGGYIGIGGDGKHNNPQGWTVRAATKYIFGFSYKENNPLDGFYVKPEIAYSNFNYDHTFSDGNTERLNCSRGALMACCGYQIVKNWFVFDFYVGAGGTIGDKCYDNYYHGFIGFNADSHAALTFGLKFGVAF